jgi:4-amino-4-deoxy-L-arabinose transferase-like glycosyltransferase
MLILQSWEFKHEWAYGYELTKIGSWLAKGHGFTMDGTEPTLKFPPVYPGLLSGVFAVFGSYSQASAIVIFLLQSLFAVGTAICLVMVGSRLFNRKVGLVAGFLWALYPSSIYYSSSSIWYCELGSLLTFLVLAIGVMPQSSLSLRRVACIGALSGLVILTDSTVSLYLAILMLWLLIFHRTRPTRIVLSLMVWVIAISAVTSPWILRNFYATGSPRLSKSNLGLELFVGNNSFSSGENDRGEAAKAFAALDQTELEFYRNQPEDALFQYLKGKALEWIKSHPVAFVKLTALRVWIFWTRTTKLGLKSWAHFAYFGPFTVLALCGLWYSRHRLWPLAPLWLFLLIYPVPYYLTHVSRTRYRYPVEPFVVLLAALTLTIWFTRRNRHTRPQPVGDVASMRPSP